MDWHKENIIYDYNRLGYPFPKNSGILVTQRGLLDRVGG